MNRASGILLHPTSLPGRFGIGSLGKEARGWVDFLHRSGQKYWQILPLGHTGFGDSPYQCFSTFAGNPLLIDPQILLEKGWVLESDLPYVDHNLEAVDFGPVIEARYPFLRKAYRKFVAGGKSDDFTNFCKAENHWLHDYALFMRLKEFHNGNSWLEWSDKFRLRDAQTLRDFAQQEADGVGFYKFLQWQFFLQWRSIKSYANERGIQVIGDIPLYVALDSADSWSSPHVFQFDENTRPLAVAGVPPDFFSATGQLWGNPLYDWDALKADRYGWWVERVKASNDLYDVIRIDHFRGFESYWSVPFTDETAMNGQWIEGPGADLFNVLREELGELPIIAEDLGVITPAVEKLRDDFDFPGMKILHFAFHSKDGNIYLPHNYCQNSVVYTGTHDNDTTCGWFNSLEDFARDNVQTYIAGDGHDIHWKMIRLAWASVSNLAVVPLQDLFGLDSKGRMNTPGTSGGGNWQWRYQSHQLTDELADVLLFLTKLFDR